MTPTNMSNGGASAYLSFFCSEDGGGTWNHGQTPFLAEICSACRFLLDVLAEMAGHGLFSHRSCCWC